MPIRIDAEDLLFALETAPGEMDHYLDLETGEVIPAIWNSLSRADPEYAQLQAIAEDAGRYRSIEPVPSRQGFRWMEEFAYEQAPAGAQRRLLDALRQRRPFSGFKDALGSFPELRDAWFAWHEQRLMEYAREWLEDEGIEAELVLPPRLRQGGGS